MKRSLSHTVWECKYHIVWVPKKRRKIIYGKLRNELRTILKRLCKYKSVEVIEGSMCIDHIHICLAIPPKYSVSTIVVKSEDFCLLISGIKCPLISV